MSSARRERIRLIRGRVVGGAIALFVGVWGVIGIQLASGNDPALKKSTSTATSNSSSATSSTSSASQPQLTTSDQSSSSVAPVTTQQS